MIYLQSNQKQFGQTPWLRMAQMMRVMRLNAFLGREESRKVVYMESNQVPQRRSPLFVAVTRILTQLSYEPVITEEQHSQKAPILLIAVSAEFLLLSVTALRATWKT